MLGPSDTHPAAVLDAWDETAALRALRLRLEPGAAARHERPGQVVKVRTGAGEGFFALASAPAPSGIAELLLKRGGAVADAAIALGAPGGALALTAPFGRGFPVDAARGRDVLLFAAGSGIAPIRALVQALSARRDEVGRITLFYGQRRGAEFAYRSEHLSWERRGIRVVLCPSAEDDAWPGVRGRVQEVARSLAYGGVRIPGAAAFVSGMPPMVAGVRAALAEAGVDPTLIHGNA